MKTTMTPDHLRRENQSFRNTKGVSASCRVLGFRPAFRNAHTGEVRLSRFANGNPAPIHVLDGLPDHWGITRDQYGHAVRVDALVVSGFVKEDKFYTRTQLRSMN